MDQVLLNLLNGVPIAAAVLYVWIISEKNHTDEIKEWRKTIEQKDAIIQEMQKTVSKLTTQIEKLTYIIETYVVRTGKNASGKQD